MNDPIDPQLLDALRRDRLKAGPEGARLRVASRLGMGIPIPKLHHGGASTAAAATKAAAAPGVLAATFVGGAAVGALLHASLAVAPPARVVYVERPAAAVPSVVASAAAPSAAAPASAGGTAVVPPSAAAKAAAPNPHAGSTQLDAERALLDSARAALVSGDSEAALSALDRHARTFRRPILAEERDALFIQVLVRAGRYQEARDRAEAFRRAAPQSLLLPAVDAAIASIR